MLRTIQAKIKRVTGTPNNHPAKYNISLLSNEYYDICLKVMKKAGMKKVRIIYP